MTGTSAEILIGAPVKAFLDEDVRVLFAGEAVPAPLVVPAVASPVEATAVAAAIPVAVAPLPAPK
jgi:hypothetical protein